MNRMKRWMKISFAAALTVTLLSGCTKPAATNGTENQEAGGAVQILFWHSMSGNNQEKLQKIVDGFNQSQDQYVVTAENQGKYDESTSKFFNMGGSEGSPAMIQIGEQNLQSMADSGLVEPLDELLINSGYDREQLLSQVVRFYTVDENLYAMPFNASSPILYYNEDALKKAGFQEAPGTFEEILAAAPEIAKANPGMKAVGIHAYGYALDQMVTNMGGLIVNNENGRSARTTQVAYQEQMVTIFTWLQQLMGADALINYGSSNENVMSGFNQQEFAMFITTSAVASSVIGDASFQVGIRPLPLPEGMEPQGVYAGGGAICVAKGLSEEKQKGVGAFLSYATSAEVQATWAGDTGYFPICKAAFDTQTMKDIYEKTPQLRVAADQFLNSKETPATAGPLLSQLPQLRNDLQSAEEMVFNGGDPGEAVAQAASNTDKQIETANKSVSK